MIGIGSEIQSTPQMAQATKKVFTSPECKIVWFYIFCFGSDLGCNITWTGLKHFINCILQEKAWIKMCLFGFDTNIMCNVHIKINVLQRPTWK